MSRRGASSATLDQLVAAADLGDAPLSVAACRTGNLPLVWAQGHWPDGSIVTTRNRLYAASLAKQLTGAAVALLARAGSIDVEAPIGRWLAHLPGWRQDVTVSMLLHHTGGLPEAGAFEADFAGHLTNAKVLAFLERLDALPFAPGTAEHYSNLGYVCLAEIVAIVAGQPFAAFLDAAILAPLGVDGMSFWVDDPAISHAQRAMLGARLPLSAGDGGLWTTAAAYARWLDSQNRDALGIAALTQQPYRLRDGAVTDYGWGVGIRQFRGRPLYIHGGSWNGAAAKAARAPEFGLSVVALAATNHLERIVALVDRLLAAVADGLTD